MRSRAQSRAKRTIHPSTSAWCSPMPRTSSDANGAGSTGSSAMTSAGVTPLVSASYSSDRARSRAWRRVAARALTTGEGHPCLDPGEVVARAGVDLDVVAGVDEQRHLHHQPRLERGRLAGARHPVALDPGL